MEWWRFSGDNNHLIFFSFLILKKIISILEFTKSKQMTQKYLDRWKLLVIKAEVRESLHRRENLMGGGVMLKIVGILGLCLHQQVWEWPHVSAASLQVFCFVVPEMKRERMKGLCFHQHVFSKCYVSQATNLQWSYSCVNLDTPVWAAKLSMWTYTLVSSGTNLWSFIMATPPG